MPSYANSIMKQSEAENSRYVRDSLNLFRKARAVGNRTDFVKKNKAEAKDFNIFRYLTHKHSSTGRFGAKKVDEASDSIKAMENASETPQKSFFDPFGMRIITEPDPAAPQGAAPAGDDLSAERMEAEQVEDDFVNRVDDEIYLGQINDFEAERSGIDARLAFAQGMEKNKGRRDDRQLLSDTSEKYRAGRAFTPDDDVIEAVPDSFNMELVVDEAPPKYSLEWMQYQADQTEGVLGRIKGFFRKAFHRPQLTEDAMFDKFVQTLPEYKKMVEDGKKNAKAAGMKEKDYDPALDTAITKFKIDTKIELDQNGQNLGHSSVRMNAKKFGAPLSTYSFMFGGSNNPGMAGTIKGVVINPARINGGEVKTKYDISYPDYLRAAAKIRGTVGSMRTYSLIGYNCSSFASEVAKAAGVPLKDEDTSSYVMTHRHYSQKVDSPYKLARLIVEKNKKEDDARKADPVAQAKEQAFNQSVDVRKTALKNAYLRQMAGTNVVTLIRKRHMFSDEDLQDTLETLIEDIVDSGADIDRENPVDGLTGPALMKAQQNRIDGRKLIFDGEISEDAILQRYVNEGNTLADYIFENNMDGSFANTFFGPALDLSKKDKIRAAMIPTRFYGRNYMHLNQTEAMRKLDHFIDVVAAKQKSIRDGILQLLTQSNADYEVFLRSLDTLLGPFELDMLGESMMVKEDALSDFLRAANLTPYGEDNKPAEEPAAAPAAAAAPKASKPEGAAHEESNAKGEEEIKAEKKPDDNPAVKPAVNPAQPVAEDVKSEAVNPAQPKAKTAKPAADRPAAAAARVEEEKPVDEKKPVEEKKPALPAGVVLEKPAEEPQKIKIPDEMNKASIKKLVFSLDKEQAVDKFIEVFSSTAHIAGYSIENGSKMTRGDMIRILSSLAKDRDANGVMLKNYSLILKDSTADGKLYHFESMLRDTSEKFPMSAIVKAFEDNGIT